MGRVIKQSAGNALSNYVGVVIGAINLLVLYPRAFEENPEYFGLIQLLISYGLVISTFTHLGIPRIIIRYFPQLDPGNRPRLLGFALIYPLPVLILLGVVLVVFQDSLIPLLSNDLLFLENWFYLFPLAVFNVYFEVLSSVAQSYYKTQIPLFLKEVERRVVLAILILVYWAGWIDLQWFLVLYVVSLVLQFGILIIYLMRQGFLTINWKFKGLTLRPMLVYGGFLFLTTGTNFLVNKIDILMVGGLINLEEVAYYSVAFFIGGILNVPGKSLTRVTSPMLAKAYASGKLEEVERIYKASAVNLLIIGLFFFTLLVANLDDLLYLLPEAYREGKQVIIFIALAQLVNISAGQNGEVISLSRYYRFNLLALSALLVLTVVNNLVFIPVMGMEGAALATLISLSLFNLIKTFFLRWKMDMLPYGKRSVLAIPLFAVAFLVGHYFDVIDNPILEIIFRSFAISVVFLPLLYWLNISEDINRLIKKALRHVA